MRDWWYGDKRDVVKWGTILVVARRCSIKCAIQVALYRADRPDYRLTINGSPENAEPLPIEVFRHFRDIDDIQRLAATAKLRIEIHKDLFQWRKEFRTKVDFRSAYFSDLAAKIHQHREPIIVFLDPDTGIAPDSYGFEHVSAREIRGVLRAMKAGDILLFYQHARLGEGDWLDSTRDEFRKAVGAGVPVDTFTCKEVANDVALFAVDRNKWEDVYPGS